MLSKYSDKIILPVDCVCGSELSNETNIRICNIDSICSDEIGLDIGVNSVDLFDNYLKKSKTIIWNGPVGAFEYDKFAEGTKLLCERLAKLDSKVIIGGGDTAAAVIKFGYKDVYTHISTGGGASLELLEGKELPGIAIIQDK